VFLDVVKYSLRKSIMQQRVVNAFSSTIGHAIKSVSAKYITESQKQNLNLSTDIILIPTGDGAAVVFPIQGLQNIHLVFALAFLNEAVAGRQAECKIFADNGWCNCHEFFDVRTGVADGKVIVFRDINGHYNVAGGTVNTAARVMSLADRQQIIFTLDAYRNLIDMTEDTTLEDRFVLHGAVSVKHKVTLDICQYVGGGENYLNRDVPLDIAISVRQRELRKSSPIFEDTASYSPAEKMRALDAMEILKDMPIPEGFSNMFRAGIPSKEEARALVDAFKSLDSVMKGAARKVIDGDRSE
jgi:hypothetical protein